MKHLDASMDFNITDRQNAARDNKERYSLTFTDLLDSSEGILVSNLVLDSKVQVTLVKQGRNGVPEVDSLQVGREIYLLPRNAYTDYIHEVAPLLLDYTQFTTLNEPVFKAFLKELESVALARAKATEIEKWTYEGMEE